MPKCLHHFCNKIGLTFLYESKPFIVLFYYSIAKSLPACIRRALGARYPHALYSRPSPRLIPSRLIPSRLIPSRLIPSRLIPAPYPTRLIPAHLHSK